MTLPIYFGGERAGELTETREGLYRVLRADCAMREGLCRLWLHGEGRSVYFGLLAPEGGRLRLERRFSRAAGLPGQIDCARDSPAAVPPPKPETPRGGLVWRRRADGSLIASDGARRYLALPASGAAPGGAARLHRIGGKDYLVFRF